MKKIMLILAILCLPFFVNAAEYCQDIYCNEFNYVCCGEASERYSLLEGDLKDYTPRSGMAPLFCPTDSDVINCVINFTAIPDILDPDHQYEFYIGTGNCDSKESKPLWVGERWVCEDEDEFKISDSDSITGRVLERGQKIYIWSDDWITVTSATVYRKVLRHTGQGTDSFAGEIVAGSVACDFNPSDFDKSYNESNQIVSQTKSLNVGECYAVTNYSLRRQCGDTCEDCRSDSDCANLYPKQTTYNNRTVGAVCSANQMLLYGCVGTGKDVCLEKDVLPDGTEVCLDKAEKKTCDIVSRVTTGIECCNSDDCRGAGDYYCSWINDLESRCVLTAQCQTNKDCGTATRCNRETMQIEEPYCDGQKQCAERNIEKVECCTSADCGSSSYCTSEHECEDKPQSAPVPVQTESTTAPTAPTGLASLPAGTESSLPTAPDLLLPVIILVLLGGGGFAAYYFYSIQPKQVPVPKQAQAPPVTTGAVCGKCSAPLKKGAKFCSGCGSKL
jgi:hypothetical protein